MAKYASTTTVSSDRTRTEIQKTLERYGATSFAYATDDELGAAMVGFKAQGRTIRFTLTMPDKSAREFTRTTQGQLRSQSAAEQFYNQDVRQKWRALLLIVKAKLEAVDSGIVTFEQEFLPHIIMPNGQTVYEATAPAIEQAYVSGNVKPLLQLGGEA